METANSNLFCRACGSDAKDKSVCTTCGCKPDDGNAFCNNCGSSTFPQAVQCVKCGTGLKKKETKDILVLLSNNGTKIAATAMLVGFVLPWLSSGIFVFTGTDMFKLADLMKLKHGEVADLITSMFMIPVIFIISLLHDFNIISIGKSLIGKARLIGGILPVAFTMWFIGDQDGEAFKPISSGLVISVVAGIYFINLEFAKKRKVQAQGQLAEVKPNGKPLISWRKAAYMTFGFMAVIAILLTVYFILSEENANLSEAPKRGSTRGISGIEDDTAGFGLEINSDPVQAVSSLPDSFYEIRSGLGPVHDGMASEQEILAAIPNAEIKPEANPEKYLMSGYDVKAVYYGNEKLFVFKKVATTGSLIPYKLILATDNPRYKTYDGIHVGSTQAEYINTLRGNPKENGALQMNLKYPEQKIFFHWVYREGYDFIFEDRNSTDDFTFYEYDESNGDEFQMWPSDNSIKLITFTGQSLEHYSLGAVSRMNKNYLSKNSETYTSNKSRSLTFIDNQSVSSYLYGKTFYSEDGSASVSIGNTIKVNGSETHFNLSFSVSSSGLGIVKGESLYNENGTITIYVNPQSGYISNAGEKYYLKD